MLRRLRQLGGGDLLPFLTADIGQEPPQQAPPDTGHWASNLQAWSTRHVRLRHLSAVVSLNPVGEVDHSVAHLPLTLQPQLSALGQRRKRALGLAGQERIRDAMHFVDETSVEQAAHQGRTAHEVDVLVGLRFQVTHRIGVPQQAGLWPGDALQRGGEHAVRLALRKLAPAQL